MKIKEKEEEEEEDMEILCFKRGVVFMDDELEISHRTGKLGHISKVIRQIVIIAGAKSYSKLMPGKVTLFNWSVT